MTTTAMLYFYRWRIKWRTGKVMSMTMGERRIVRAELDSLPDFFIAGKEVGFRKEFRSLSSDESFCEVPPVVLERARLLRSLHLVDTVAKTVHDTVFFELGCSRIPVFAGDGRT